MLTLPIKKKWFDMIASGKKTEEYRTIKPYYEKRFSRYGIDVPFELRLRAGYAKTSPLMECLVSVKISTGKPKWGAIPNVEYFTLTILNVRLY